jgi:diamine N-acetyltransferase
MVHLKEITKDNFWDIIELKVHDDQKEYVLENSISIAQAKVQPECIPLAIYNGDTLVGFLMYCIDTDDDNYWIYRFMIDKKHQKRGYGRKAMEILLDKIKEDKNHSKIVLDVKLESIAAVGLYKNLGFKFTGQIYGSSHVMELEY